MTRPVAYVRRSAAGEDNPGDASREVQEQAIRDMIARDGHNGDVAWFVDWGRSADESKLAKRTEYAAMLRAVESGEVSTIYAYAMDRLHRSVIETGKLMIACRDRHVRIVTKLEGEISDEDPAKWLMVTTLATQAEFFLRVAKVRAKANMARRRAHDHYIGVAPYGMVVDKATHKAIPNPREDVGAVMEAYQRANGNFDAAANLLSTDPILSRRAQPRRAKFWSPTSVARIVRRVEQVPKRGRVWEPPKLVKDYALYKLLRCPHEGNRLTAQRTTSGNGKKFVRYVCRTGVHDPKHPRPYSVAESIVLPWLEDRLRDEGYARMEVRRKTIGGGPTRDELEKERRNLALLLRTNNIDGDEYLAEVERIDAELADLPEDGDTSPIVISFTRPLDLTADPTDINAKLRRALDRIELDGSMRPKEVIWK